MFMMGMLFGGLLGAAATAWVFGLIVGWIRGQRREATKDPRRNDPWRAAELYRQDAVRWERRARRRGWKPGQFRGNR